MKYRVKAYLKISANIAIKQDYPDRDDQIKNSQAVLGKSIFKCNFTSARKPGTLSNLKLST
jgi:hypothetical protein